MKKYLINIKKVEWGFVEVEAKNEREAESKGFDALENGAVYWNKEDIEDVDISEIK